MSSWNSRIKQKTGVCVDCILEGDTNEKLLIAGRCQYHYKIYRISVVEQEEKQRGKNKERFSRLNPELVKGHRIYVRKKTAIDVPEMVIPTTELQLWFEQKIELLSHFPYCSECKEKIPPAFYGAAVAHILPKAHFHSIETHPLNYLFLGAGCGCHDRSHRLDTFSKMRVFRVAVERFLKFRNEITEHHKLLDTFIKYAKL